MGIGEGSEEDGCIDPVRVRHPQGPTSTASEALESFGEVENEALIEACKKTSIAANTVGKDFTSASKFTIIFFELG